MLTNLTVLYLVVGAALSPMIYAQILNDLPKHSKLTTGILCILGGLLWIVVVPVFFLWITYVSRSLRKEDQLKIDNTLHSLARKYRMEIDL